jgi:chromosome segregation ATPase
MFLTSPLPLFLLITFLTIAGFIFLFVNLISKHKEQIRIYTDQIDDADIACEKLKHQLSTIENKNILLSSNLDKIRHQHRKHLDRLKPEYHKMYTQLMTTIDKLDSMTSKFHDAQDAFDSLLDDNRELEHELHELSSENLHLRDEIVSLRSKITELETVPAPERANQTENNQIAGTDNSQFGDRIIGNNSDMHNAEVETFESPVDKQNDAIHANLVDLESQKSSLMLDIELLTNKLSDLESLQNASLQFKTQQEEIVQLKSTIEALLLINSELSAKGLYLESAPGEHLEIPQTSSTIHDSLSNALSTITSNANVKASTVADSLGLIVAEKGQRKYTEGLAGIAASFDSLNKQIHSFIPIGELKQITVTDKNDVTVSAFPFTVSDEKLVVMLLSAGSAPTTSAVEKALTGAAHEDKHSTAVSAQNSGHFVIAQ